jgi:hypothetical protein
VRFGLNPARIGLTLRGVPPDAAAQRRSLLLCLLLAGLCAAWNVGKAVHMDDTAGLLVAQAIARAPLGAMSQPVFWDQPEPRPIFELNQPHLFYAALAPLTRSAHVELLAHALVALLTLGCILLFHRLARRTAPGRADLLTLALFAGPAFLPSQNVMNEVPLLLCWLGCTLFLLPKEGQEEPSESRLALAGLCAGLACLVKYSALVLLPLLAWEIVRRRRWRALWVLAIPASLLGAWSGLNLLEVGRSHLFGRPVHVAQAGLLDAAGDALGRCVLWPLAFGACAPFALSLLPGLWSRRGGRWAIGLIASFATLMPLVQAGVALASHGASQLDPPSVGIGRALFLALGGSALAAVAFGPGDGIDRTLRLQLLAASAFLTIFSPFVAVRHALLVLPAWLLLAARGPFWPKGRPLALGLCATAALGGLAAVGDLRQAEVYRQGAARWARALQAGEPGHRVYFVGHWGFQWYAERAGMLPYLPGSTRLEPGDALVRPEQVHQQAISAAHKTLLREVAVEPIGAGPLDLLRTLPPCGGFYITSKLPPFAPCGAPLETFRVYRAGP